MSDILKAALVVAGAIIVGMAIYVYFSRTSPAPAPNGLSMPTRQN